MNTSNPLRLVFPGEKQVEIESFELPPLAPDEVCVRAHHSLMSTGTENIVFNRWFDPGTHWDKWVQYPFYPGYAVAGEVESVGVGVSTLKPGDRVVIRGKHRSHAAVKADACYPVPDGVPLEQAIWFALAKITFNAAFAAQYRLGESVLIIGAGPIGQMSLRWARASGAKHVLVADPAPEREKFSLAGGAKAYFAQPANEAVEAIKAANDGALPTVVVDSTGHPAAFTSALAVAAEYGRVIIVGDVGRPAQQCLTSDVIIRGLSITGVHDSHKFPGWTQASITQLFFSMILDGRIAMGGLNTHTFAPQDCKEAYAVANRDRAKTMGIVFDWNA